MNSTRAWFIGTLLGIVAFVAVVAVIVVSQNYREESRQSTKRAAAEAGCNYNNGEIICLQKTKTVTVE
jgi:hypothetical protein